MKKLGAVLLALLLALALGCSAAQKTETAATASESENASAADSKEETELKQNPIATITMDDGNTMTLELYPDVAPITVANFISLANSGFYDGLTFHRIYAGFMIQGGAPDGNGGGGPGYSIKGEFAANGVENNLSHKRGVISMARATNPDSAGSQFFIMHADADFLDGQYAAFGMMTEGFVELDRLAATPVTTNPYSGERSVPLQDVVIRTIRVETFGVDYGEPEKIQ